MSKAGHRHAVIAASILLAVAVTAALSVQRYVDHGQERKLNAYRGLALAIEMAALSSARGGDGVEAEGNAWLQASMRDGRVLGGMFVRTGGRVPGLNITRPAQVVVDVTTEGEQRSASAEAGRDSRGSGAERMKAAAVAGGRAADTERLITLCARLAEELGRGHDTQTAGPRDLSWQRVSDPSVVVAAAPAVTATGELLGVAAVEMHVPARGSRSVSLAGLAILLSGVLAFAFLRKAHVGSLAAFAAAGGLVFTLSLAAGGLHNREGVERFVQQREAATSEFLNATLFAAPCAALALDRTWEQVFKYPAEGVQLSLPAGTLDGPFLATEGLGGSLGLFWGRMLPVLAVLLLCLLVGLTAVRGLTDVVWGVATMPGAYAYVAPAMLGMAILVLVPFLMGVGLGFFNADFEFVGLTNFYDILVPSQKSDTNFYLTLGFTVMWTVSNVAAHLVIGLGLALVLVSSKVRFKGLFRVLLIVPWAVPNYITALVWKWMFTSELGAVNLMLSALGVDNPPVWFGPSFWTNYFAALMTNIWLGFPFMMVVSMGALQSIPADLYEAADIDGASRWQKFRNITLPLLKPALFPAVILGCIWTFNMFNVIYLVTRGNPDHKTNILITEAYRFFSELNQYGVAAAYCVLIFVILLLYTLVTNRVTKATQGAFE